MSPTTKSFRALNAYVRAVRLPSEIGVKPFLPTLSVIGGSWDKSNHSQCGLIHWEPLSFVCACVCDLACRRVRFTRLCKFDKVAQIDSGSAWRILRAIMNRR